MKFGFKLDKYMNSVYLALVNLIMLFALFNTNQTVDIILNALAVEFITGFDEEVAGVTWYDPGKRYLRASVIEVHIRAVLLLEPFDIPEDFCRRYDCEMSEYEKVINGPIFDPEQADKDELLPQFMDFKERNLLTRARLRRNS